MALDEILQNKVARRTFIIAVALILLLLAGGWAYFSWDKLSSIETMYGALADVLLAVFSTILTSVLIWAYLTFISPASDELRIEVIGSERISKAFKSALGNATSWHFKGGFGRYLRAAVIPTLSDRAATKHQSIIIEGVILNPKNGVLCDFVAKHRSSIKNHGAIQQWTKEIVQDELLATALVASMFDANNSLLDVRLFVTDHFLPTRFDLSGEVSLVTREDKKAPAVSADRKSNFYAYFEHEVSVAKRQSRELTLPEQAPRPGQINATTALPILLALDLCDENYDRGRLAEVCRIANDNYNPY